MRVRMFKPQFAQMVKDGTKRQTIRPVPKRPVIIGSQESWRQWSDKPYRSPQIQLATVTIENVERIAIDETENLYEVWLMDRPYNGALLMPGEWDEIANDDGFKSMFDLVQWFKNEHGLPFEGILIKAKDL